MDRVKNDRFLLNCKKCHHEWIKRLVDRPKMCPKCKTYDWRKKEEEMEDLF